MPDIVVPDDCPRLCPLKGPVELLAQRTNLDLESLHRDVHRLKDLVNGNGKDGLSIRVERLEMNDKTINDKLNVILVDIDKIKQAAENWRAKAFSAAIQLAAGGGGAIGILKLIEILGGQGS